MAQIHEPPQSPARNEWPLSRARATPFHLHSNGKANTIHGDGVLSLEPPPEDSPVDHYVYDPRDPVMSLMREDAQAAPVNQAPHDHRRDILVYQTPRLERDIEIIGPVTLKLWAATDGPDTDWTAKLAVVKKSGLCINLTYGILRASNRNGYAHPAPVEPERPYEFTVPLNPIAVLFRKGERIRLYVSSSDFPNFDRNHNTGRDYWSDPELRTARQEHPAIKQWEERLRETQRTDAEDAPLFDRELFYAVQPGERLDALMDRYRRLFD